MNDSSLPIAFYKHTLHPEDAEAVIRVLQSNHLTTGHVTQQFEEKFAFYTGCRFAVGVSNGTSALFLSLLACGIGLGDEVITTPMTFVSTVNAILHIGATPVLIDVEPDTGLLDLDRLEDAITAKTKAVIPVHLYGQMVDMARLSRICADHQLFVIEDAAHAIEASRDHIRPGDLSHLTCYSFYATKNLTCGEGGAITTNQETLYHKLQKLRLHGIHRPVVEDTSLYSHWDMQELGYKMNLSDILSALLVHQLDRLEHNWLQRHQRAERYHSALTGIPGLDMPTWVPQSRHAHHLFPVWVPPSRRDQTLLALAQQGIGAAVHYRALTSLTYYQQRGFRIGQFPHAEHIGQRTLSLPLYPTLQSEEQERIIRTITQISNSW